jgi:Asp/Glu/hydantoin racemase
MKLLWLNPNMTETLTAGMVESARSAAAPGTDVIPYTAAYGVPYISSRAEATIGARIVLEVLAERRHEIDAAVVAAFADPGLPAARELFPFPVVGMAEAAMLTACMLGRRFSIVSFAAAMEPIFRECVEYNGLLGRLASIRLATGGVADIATMQGEKERALVALAKQAVTEDGADVIVFGGAPLAGLAAKVADDVPVPIVDGPAAAVKMAEALVALAPRKATAGTFRRPGPKPTAGLPESLAAFIGHREKR